MTRCFIQQHPQWSPWITSAHTTQEGLKMLLPHVRSTRHDSVSGADVDGAEKYSFSVPAGNRNHGLLTAQRPGPSQYGEQSEDGFIFHEQHCTWRQVLQFPNNRPFFCARCGSFSE